MAKCNQTPVFRYTWPGRPESFACLEHAQGISAVAQAIGLFLQFIPLSGEQQAKVSCQNEVKEEEEK
jgi:hypothetical protein